MCAQKADYRALVEEEALLEAEKGGAAASKACGEPPSKKTKRSEEDQKRGTIAISAARATLQRADSADGEEGGEEDDGGGEFDVMDIQTVTTAVQKPISPHLSAKSIPLLPACTARPSAACRLPPFPPPCECFGVLPSCVLSHTGRRACVCPHEEAHQQCRHECDGESRRTRVQGRR